MAESESQKRYNKKYQKEHRMKANHYVDKSKTKKFILKESSLKELKQIKQWLNQRLNELTK